MAYDYTSDKERVAGNEWGSFLNNLGKFFINNEVDTSAVYAQTKAKEASQKAEEIPSKYQDLANFLNDRAKRFPSYRKTLQNLGFLNSDNTVNFKKMLDRGYLNEMNNRLREEVNQYKSTLNKQNLVNNARSTIRSTATRSQSNKALADLLRNQLKQYSNIYKGEKEQAYNKALSLGNKLATSEQSDYSVKTNLGAQSKQASINKAKQKYQNALGDYNLASQYANNQSLGILQDPQKAADFAATVSSIVSGGGIGNLIGKGKSGRQIKK